jgi:cytochrome oxidase Cu insertion factor (SCO1/SenC/PrrC family)
VDHGSYLYLIDPQGRLVNLFPFGTPASRISTAVRTLLEAQPGCGEGLSIDKSEVRE